MVDDLNGQDWEKTREIQEYQEGQVDTLGLLWDIALARGQSNTNAQCLSHCSLLATSHVWLLKTRNVASEN